MLPFVAQKKSLNMLALAFHGGIEGCSLVLMINTAVTVFLFPFAYLYQVVDN